jgi:hypothetical protein
MSKRALGPGAVCCGEPEGCDVGCFQQEPVATPAPAPVIEDDEDALDLFDEEVEE